MSIRWGDERFGLGRADVPATSRPTAGGQNGTCAVCSPAPHPATTASGRPELHLRPSHLNPTPGPAGAGTDMDTISLRAPLDDRPEPRLQPCCQAASPEHFEFCPLVARVTDRKGDRYISPLGDSREHSVRCTCGTSTWALDARCDRCATADAVRAATRLREPARKKILG